MLVAYGVPTLICLFGAAFQELLYWYQLRAKLEESDYVKMLSSQIYWIITFLMIFATPVGVLVWFSDTLAGLKPRDFFLFGASFPLIVKTGIATIVARQDKVILGEERPTTPFKSYFGF